MDETQEVEVTNTHIQRFDCGCTTTITVTAKKKRPQAACGAHNAVLVSELILQEYPVCTSGFFDSQIDGASNP